MIIIITIVDNSLVAGDDVKINLTIILIINDSDNDDFVDDDDNDDDIYIMMQCVSVTKNDHFSLPSKALKARSETTARPCRP